jgi:D-amino-acid oxidase
MSSCNIAVIGAGVIGLSSAVRIVEEYRKLIEQEIARFPLRVTVYADKFTPETTSDGAGT